MGSLGRSAVRLAGISLTAGGAVAAGRIGIWLAFSLMTAIFLVITVLAMTGTFARDDKRKLAAQRVLAILLGREVPREEDTPGYRPAHVRSVLEARQLPSDDVVLSSGSDSQHARAS